jgi:SAM-dependent methyltransferase
VGALSVEDIAAQIGTLRIAERVFDAIVLYALVALGVFPLLTRPRTRDELLHEIGGRREVVSGLLDAATALDFLRQRGGWYTAAPALAATLGHPEHPAYLGDWVRFLHAVTPALGTLAGVARGAPQAANLLEDSEPGRAMTRAMRTYALAHAEEVAQGVDLEGVHTLLDVGCGPGTYAFALLERAPALRATLLDLPGPLAEARRAAEARGLAERLAWVEGDARTYRPAAGHDLVLLSNVLHMMGRDSAAALLRRCREFVRPGGRLVLQGMFLEADRTSPRWPALLNLIELAATPEGRNHTREETVAWLAEAGFTGMAHRRLSVWNPNSLLIARRDP